MPSALIRTTFTAFALATTSILHAQTSAAWPIAGTHADYGTVEVITLSQPKVRHYCRVHSVTTDAITCGIGAGRKPFLYHRDDVAAILNLVTRTGDQFFSTLAVTAGVTVLFAVTAIVVSPAVPIAILASAFGYGVYSLICPHPSWRSEEVLYQRPNTPLAVVIRNH